MNPAGVLKRAQLRGALGMPERQELAELEAVAYPTEAQADRIEELMDIAQQSYTPAEPATSLYDYAREIGRQMRARPRGDSAGRP